MLERTLFIQLLERLINQKLQKFCGKQYSEVSLNDMYSTIHEVVFDIFKKCEFDLTEDSKYYVINNLIKSISINKQEDCFKDGIWLRRTVSVKNIPNSDLRLLRRLMTASIMEEELEEELRKRNSD